MLSLEDILSEMEKNTKFTRKQLYEKVKNKHEELSGLVSMEGAAHLVARDLGVSILVPDKRELKIKDIVNRMRKINIKGRIIQVSDTREFERKDGKKGRVCNLIITDGTGEVRIPLWDKQVNMLDEGKLNEGNVIQIKNAFARDNVFGGIEIRLSRLSRIEKIEDDESFPRKIVGTRLRRIPIKEAKEELGIDINPQPLFYLKSDIYNQHVWIFRVENDGPFKLDPKELCGGKFISMENLKKETKETPEKFAKEFIQILDLI